MHIDSNVYKQQCICISIVSERNNQAHEHKPFGSAKIVVEGD